MACKSVVQNPTWKIKTQTNINPDGSSAVFEASGRPAETPNDVKTGPCQERNRWASGSRLHSKHTGFNFPFRLLQLADR